MASNYDSPSDSESSSDRAVPMRVPGVQAQTPSSASDDLEAPCTDPPSNSWNKRERKSQNSRPSMLQHKRMKLLEAINTWIPTPCCKRSCAHEIGVEECRRQRESFLRSSRDHRKQMLIDLMVEGGAEPQECCFRINGWKVCWNFIIDAFGISRSLIANVSGLPSANASPLPGRMGGSAGSSTMKSGVIAFLRVLADEVADEIPNSNERHLPHGSKKLVFLLYQDNELRYSRQACNQSHFYRTWKEHAANIKCRRSHGFTVCDTCTQFKEKLQSLARITGQEIERDVVGKRFGNHLRQIRSERAEYRLVQTMSTERPNHFLSVIIDGADQAKFGLPRFPTQTKRETGNVMKQKVTGVLFHGAVLRQDLLCFLLRQTTFHPEPIKPLMHFVDLSLFLLRKEKHMGSHSSPKNSTFNWITQAKTTRIDYSSLFAICWYILGSSGVLR